LYFSLLETDTVQSSLHYKVFNCMLLQAGSAILTRKCIYTILSFLFAVDVCDHAAPFHSYTQHLVAISGYSAASPIGQINRQVYLSQQPHTNPMITDKYDLRQSWLVLSEAELIAQPGFNDPTSFSHQ